MPVNPVSPAPGPINPADPLGTADAVKQSQNITPTSTNDGTVVTMPNVAAPTRPLSEGEVLPDAGDDAELLVLHAIVGEFVQGSRITRAQLGDNVNVDRLVKLEAVAILKDAPAPADAPQAPAKGKGAK